ncbi:MAG TPA: tetratricopeptide repeat protein [Sphingobium sp.]
MSAGLETKFLKAKRAESRGDEAEARRILEEVLSRHPNNRKAIGGLARLDQTGTGFSRALQSGIDQMLNLYVQNDHAGVIAVGEPLLSRFPRAANVGNLLGAAYLSIEDYVTAESAFRRSIEADPQHQPSHNNLGLALKKLNRADEAEVSFKTAIDLNPADLEARFNLACHYRDEGRREESGAAFQDVLALQPDHVEARHWVGNVHRSNNAYMEAIDWYLKALTVKPDHFPSIINMAHALLDMGQLNSAADVYHQATLVDPDSIQAHFRFGSVLKLLGAMDRSHQAYSRALELDPSNPSIKAHLLYQEAIMSDWHARHKFTAIPFEKKDRKDTVEPFVALTFVDDPAVQLKRSQVHEQTLLTKPAAPFDFPAKKPGEKIRIGYFSADFHNHATLYLLAGMLREHDRDAFEIRAYSYGTLNGEMRNEIMPFVDSFVDIRGMTDEQAVAQAREDGLDIAVDLKGYTRDARMALFAMRMAPVQIAYIGYPGSVGGAEIDYIIADHVVIPEGDEHHYSERVIRIPGSYQANDNRRAIGTCPNDRTRLGLPATGFVFCCFNQSYKIGPQEFDIWMRLLHQVEGSVLWLIKSNDWSDDNLRKEAQARGIDPARLVFAEKVEQAPHLARQRHADLFLDTFAVNAHTTTSDALWGGLPVLTLMGRQFAARVAASLLHAIDLPDLVTTTTADYEAKALELARSPDKLAALRARLEANRLTTPLFDTVTHTRHIESAYRAAHQRWLDGQAPDHITVG